MAQLQNSNITGPLSLNDLSDGSLVEDVLAYLKQLNISEGSFTPTGEQNITVDASGTKMNYFKIGKLVFIYGFLHVKSNGTSAGVPDIIGGLPFTANGYCNIAVSYTNHPANAASYMPYSFETVPYTKTMKVCYWSSGRSWNSDGGLSAQTSYKYIDISGVYFTND